MDVVGFVFDLWSFGVSAWEERALSQHQMNHWLGREEARPRATIFQWKMHEVTGFLN